jgi:hypothetical protein
MSIFDQISEPTPDYFIGMEAFRITASGKVLRMRYSVLTRSTVKQQVSPEAVGYKLMGLRWIVHGHKN